MSNYKPFKITDLTPLTQNELDSKDLFLISDYDGKPQYTSRSLSYETLSSKISNGISENVKTDIQENIETYAPIQQWESTSGVKNASNIPELASEFENDFIIDCGNSEGDSTLLT